jgi:hypothetical protein
MNHLWTSHESPARSSGRYGFDYDHIAAISDTRSVRKERSTAIKVYLKKS